MRMQEQQCAVVRRATKYYEDAQEHLAARSWEDAIESIKAGLREVETAGSQADDALLSSLNRALEYGSNALRARDTARLEARRLSAKAQQAANDRRYVDMLQALEKATGTCKV